VSLYNRVDFELYSRLPRAVNLALGRGDITLLQFLILNFLHMKADRATGVVLSFRAEMVLDWFADMDCREFSKPSAPSLRTIQRHVRALVQQGWCKSAYRKFKKTPYNITLCNFLPIKTQNDDPSVHFGRDADKILFCDVDKSESCDADIVLLNPSTITSWKDITTFRDAEHDATGDADEYPIRDAELALNTQNAGTPAAGCGQENLDKSPVPQTEDADQKAGLKLRKALAKISSELLHNTRLAPKNLGFKFELLASTYGHEAVTQDYANWCREHLTDKPKYPITDYVRVIDSRLGSVPEEEKISLTDPRIAELAAYAFATTGKLASKLPLARLLMKYPVDEIQDAMVELMESLTSDNEINGALRSFYQDGGADAIIATRRNRGKR
jgi:hypothetical protein